MKLLVEIAAYGVFAAAVGLLSVWPVYEVVDDDVAIISLVFSHAGERVGDCRQISQEELNKLPPNMRKPTDCPRERHPILVELKSGGVSLYREHCCRAAYGRMANPVSIIACKLRPAGMICSLVWKIAACLGFDTRTSPVLTLSLGATSSFNFMRIQERLSFGD